MGGGWVVLWCSNYGDGPPGCDGFCEAHVQSLEVGIAAGIWILLLFIEKLIAPSSIISEATKIFLRKYF